MKCLNFDKVLCLSPHPDDIEIGLGGSIIKYSDTQFDMLTLSGGGDFEGTGIDVREIELINAWQVTNINNILINVEPSLKPKNNTEDFLVNTIETSYLNDHQAIFVPTYIDAHFEHRMTNRLAAALTRCKNISIIEYRTPSTLNDWIPNMYVDITNEYEQKLLMLSKFSSQQNKEYFKRDMLDAFHTDFQSSKKGNKFVEHLKIIQLYGI